ncbi:MAG: hypothetical protein PWP64_1286 [Candidatus Cloacimonadota bacterium]|nr:hypothetical protein [Candidatus Cloacimonadota bacterium]
MARWGAPRDCSKSTITFSREDSDGLTQITRSHTDYTDCTDFIRRDFRLCVMGYALSVMRYPLCVMGYPLSVMRYL